MWCSGRGVDPITCPIDLVLDYLTHLFHLGTPARTIGGHRSAISAYHHPIAVGTALVATGRHPLVSAVMSGINHLRPPQPYIIPYINKPSQKTRIFLLIDDYWSNAKCQTVLGGS